MELNYGMIRFYLPWAILLGAVMAVLVSIILANTNAPIAKQSYDYWTGEAAPLRIQEQYQAGGDKVWMVGLENAGESPLDFYGVSVGGSGQDTHWILANASHFAPHESKVVLIPIPEPCRKNATYTYSLNITYAWEGSARKEVESGRFPIFGRCS